MVLPYPNWRKLSLYDHGSVIPLWVPAYDAWPLDINNRGQIIVYAWDNNPDYHYIGAFLCDESGGCSSIPRESIQINDSGLILGGSIVNGNGVWWVYKDGVFETVVGELPNEDWLSVKLYESGQVLFKNNHTLFTRCAQED